MSEDFGGARTDVDNRSMKDEVGDLDALRAAYDAFLGDGATVTAFEAPDGTGFSSETFLVDVDRGGAVERQVLRCEPQGEWPVFESYDLSLQVDCMEALAGKAAVPTILAKEYSGDAIGRPFYAMGRVDGQIPVDSPPYTMMGWVHEASPEHQRAIYVNGMDAMADVHVQDPSAIGLSRLLPDDPGTGYATQLAAYRRMRTWALGDRDNAIVDAAFDWLDEHPPTAPVPDGITWGDARISNMIFGAAGEVEAILDWEMATAGPGEIDLAWYLYMDRVFTDTFGMDKLPGFPGEDALIAQWEERLGRSAQDMETYFVFAGLRFAIIMARLGLRAMATGAIPEEERVDRNNLGTRLLARTIGVPEAGPMGSMG